jgi:hypothetical protein
MSEELSHANFGESPDLSVEALAKVCREVHKSLLVTPSPFSTYIIVVAIHQDSNKNFINRLNCKKGVPIGGYVYDNQSDSYFIECSDFLHLGHVPISFVVEQKNCESWQNHIPIPEATIKKYLSPLQKKELKNFVNHFKGEDYKISYVQMINPN